MKKIAKLLTGITIVVLLFVGYYILSSRLYTDVHVTVTPAREMQTEFERVSEDVALGRYDGLTALDTIGSYSFVTLDVTAKNYSIFEAEWAQLTMRTVDSDVLLYSQDDGPKDIASFGTGRFSVTILTRSTNIARSGWLEYYIFGRLHSLNVAPDLAA